MVKNMKVLAAITVIILFGASFAFAQEEEGGFDFGLSIGIGANTIGGEPYSSFILSPDIAIGKFGIGLELILNYQMNEPFPDSIRTEDWAPSGDQTFLDVYLPKFRYIRYGFKGEPLYVKLGSIDDAILGNGFIMNGYDNTLFLPERRIFGLSFDLDGALFNFPYIGIETFVGNLAQLDVMGVRTFVRPLAFTEIPVIKDLQVGGTFATDRKPGLYDPSATGDEDPVMVYGADIRLPILTNQILSLALFSDIAAMQIHNDSDTGVGGMVGFGGRLFGFMNYGAQIRILGADFIPNYFDYAYDMFRYENYVDLINDKYGDRTGWLGSLGFAFLDDALIFNVSVEGPFALSGTATGLTDWPHLSAAFILGEGIVPNLSLEAIWDQPGLGRDETFFKDILSAKDAVFVARVNYSIEAAVLSLVYQYTKNPVTGLWESKSGIQSAIKLF
jgi:hypothetical protein